MLTIPQIILLHFLTFPCAMIAFVYSDVLTQPSMLLAGFYKFVEKHIGKYPFLFKPFIDCFRCVAGQLALWAGVFVLFYNYVAICNTNSFIESLTLLITLVFVHFYIICLTIFISWIISKHYHNN